MLRPRRTGFSMLEVIALVAIMSIIAAVAIPITFTGSDYRGVVDTKEALDSIQAGLNGWRVGIVAYPQKISMLSDSGVADNDPDQYRNSCAALFTDVQIDDYNNDPNEPFLKRVISTTGGYVVPIGIIDDLIPTRANTTADMFVRIRNVKVQDGQLLNDLVDGTAEADAGDGSNTAGNLRYPVPSANGTYTQVDFRVTRTANSC